MSQIIPFPGTMSFAPPPKEVESIPSPRWIQAGRWFALANRMQKNDSGSVLSMGSRTFHSFSWNSDFTRRTSPAKLSIKDHAQERPAVPGKAILDQPAASHLQTQEWAQPRLAELPTLSGADFRCMNEPRWEEQTTHTPCTFMSNNKRLLF